jgi:hypothetical protein
MSRILSRRFRLRGFTRVSVEVTDVCCDANSFLCLSQTHALGFACIRSLPSSRCVFTTRCPSLILLTVSTILFKHPDSIQDKCHPIMLV